MGHVPQLSSTTVGYHDTPWMRKVPSQALAELEAIHGKAYRNYTDDHTKLFLTVQNKVFGGQGKQLRQGVFALTCEDFLRTDVFGGTPKSPELLHFDWDATANRSPCRRHVFSPNW